MTDLIEADFGPGEEVGDGLRAHARSRSPGDAILVHEVLDTYLATEGKEHTSDYRGRANRLKDYFGNVPISSITSAVLSEYVAARQRGEFGSGRPAEASYASKNAAYQRDRRRRLKGIPVVHSPKAATPASNESIRHELKLLRRALKGYALRDDARREEIAGYVGTHPITCVKLPPPGAPRTRRISDDELQRILKLMSCPRKRAAILCAIYTSLRRSEVLSLRIEDIDWEQRTVRLRAPVQQDPARPGQMRKRPKTKTVEREVPLIPEALELLRATCQGSKGLIFDILPGSLTQAFGRAAERAGVKNVTVHDTRRESLSWLHDVHGLTLEQLTMFSGHTEVKVLQKHYFQPSSSKLAISLAAKGRGMRDLGL